MEKKNVSKTKSAKKCNIDKAKINTVEPVINIDEEELIEPVKKIKKVVKNNIDNAKIHDVEHIVTPVLEQSDVEQVEIQAVENVIKPIKKVVKKKISCSKTHTIEPVKTFKTDNNNNCEKTVELIENKVLCDQINIFNESHKKKLKKCTNNNFNIFD